MKAFDYNLVDLFVVPGHFYEVVSIYYISKANPHPRIKSTFECISIGEDAVIFREVFDSEVLEKFSRNDPLVIPKTLVKQLLREVSEEDAIALIKKVSMSE